MSTVTIPITNLGVDGIVTDVPPVGRSFSQLTNAQNVRVTDVGLETLPAMTEVLGFGRTPTFAEVFYLSDNSGGNIICFDDGVIKYIDSSFREYDITPDTPPSITNYYYAHQMNDIFILTNGADVPWIITEATLASGGKLTPMTTWPTNYRCGIFESINGFLVAGRLTIDGREHRALVKWAHPLSPGDIDFDWDHLDPTTLAGENQLSVAGRNMMAMKAQRDHVLIFFDSAVRRMTHVGGGLIMRFESVLEDDGCVGPHALCDVGGKTVVCGYHDIYITDGFNATSITNGKIERSLFLNMRVNEKIQFSYYPYRNEVFMLVEQRPGLVGADTAIIWNARRNVFTTMRIPGTDGTGGATYMYTGVKFGGSDTTYDDAERQALTYDDADFSYNSVQNYDEGLDFFLLSAQDRKLYQVDRPNTVCHGPQDVLIEISSIDMQSWYKSIGTTMKTIVRLYPYAIGTGTLRWTWGGADTLNTSKTYWPDVEQDLVEDYAVDYRMTERYLAFQIKQGAGDNSMFSISGFEIETMLPHAGRQ